jgi:hypothetical protein
MIADSRDSDALKSVILSEKVFENSFPSEDGLFLRVGITIDFRSFHAAEIDHYFLQI